MYYLFTKNRFISTLQPKKIFVEDLIFIIRKLRNCNFSWKITNRERSLKKQIISVPLIFLPVQFCCFQAGEALFVLHPVLRYVLYHVYKQFCITFLHLNYCYTNNQKELIISVKFCKGFMKYSLFHSYKGEHVN